MATVIPKVTQLSSRVIRVLGCNPSPMTLQGTNTYIIGSSAKRVLLDAGEANNEEYVKNLSDVLKTNSISLQKLIISHWHHDHIGGLSSVLSICGNQNLQVSKFPHEYSTESEKSFHHVKDAEEIKVDGATLKIIHTPGHTTDHIIVYLKEENAVFSGDCILGEGTTVFEDLYLYMKSLQTILDIAPSVIYPGHGPVINNPVEVITEYINHRNQRESQIIEALKSLDKPVTPLDLVPLVYKVIPPGLENACAYNIMHHLEKLQKEGVVNTTGDNSWVIFSSTSKY